MAQLTIIQRCPNIADMIVNPAFYQPVKNGCSRGNHRNLNRWAHFWNMTGARNYTKMSMCCVICNHPVKKRRKKYRVCEKHRQLYLQLVKAGKMEHAYFRPLEATV